MRGWSYLWLRITVIWWNMSSQLLQQWVTLIFFSAGRTEDDQQQSRANYISSLESLLNSGSALLAELSVFWAAPHQDRWKHVIVVAAGWSAVEPAGDAFSTPRLVLKQNRSERLVLRSRPELEFELEQRWMLQSFVAEKEQRRQKQLLLPHCCGIEN